MILGQQPAQGGVGSNGFRLLPCSTVGLVTRRDGRRDRWRRGALPALGGEGEPDAARRDPGAPGTQDTAKTEIVLTHSCASPERYAESCAHRCTRLPLAILSRRWRRDLSLKDSTGPSANRTTRPCSVDAAHPERPTPIWAVCVAQGDDARNLDEGQDDDEDHVDRPRHLRRE